MRLARRLTHNWRWLVPYLIIVAVGFGLYREVSRSVRVDRELLIANHRAVFQACREGEKLRSVVRTIMQQVIVFNEQTATVASLERAAVYRRIVAERLQPTSCN